MEDLRDATPGEEAMFAAWEVAERPYPWTAAQFRPMGASRTFVLEEGGAAVAFAVLQIVDDEAHLLNLMVNPAARRKGHGATLLQKVMIGARHRGARQFFLDVDAVNEPALALYRKAGFNILERRRAAYPRGEDALVMKKDL